MDINGAYQYSLVEKLSFVRYGGTDGEIAAAKILMDEIESAGGIGEYMEFPIPAYEVETCSAKIIYPFKRELTVIPYGLSGEFPEGGVDLKFMYADRGVAEDYIGIDDLSDTAVLISELNFEAYKLLCEKHAAAFLTFSGKWYDNDDNSDLVPRPLRPKFLENGKVPGFMIRTSEATDIVRAGASMIHLELRETEKENTSRDVIAVIPGTEITNESVALTAHYDSVLVGSGSWDNATGAATLMYLYRYFLENPPKRTMRFIWCGSEEQGLYGSKAYVTKKAELLSEIKFLFNFDMCGTVLGNNFITVTGGDDLKNYVAQYCRHVGHSAAIEVKVHSSDSAPFADKGIPGVGISRGTRTAEIHTRYDLLFPISADALKITGKFACDFIAYTVNSVILPVGTGMPDNMKEALDKYFQRDKTPYKPEKGEDTVSESTKSEE